MAAVVGNHGCSFQTAFPCFVSQAPLNPLPIPVPSPLYVGKREKKERDKQKE